MVNVRFLMHWTAAVAVAFCITVSPTTNAVDLEKETSLRLAPSDADFYAGGMQLSEQWKQFESSKFYKALLNASYVKRLTKQWNDEWKAREGQVGSVRNTIENPNIMSLLRLAQDMFSEEVFILGDSQCAEFVVKLANLTDEMNKIMIEATEESSNEMDAAQTIFEYILNLPKEEIDDIPVPTIVMGFKVSDSEAVLGKIDELEGILRFGLSAVPNGRPFANGIERVEDSRGTRLAWSVRSEMIPWVAIPDNGVEELREAIEKLESLFDGRQICITIGMLDSYFVFGFSEDADAIASLGEGASLLTNPDLKEVVDNATKKITSVAYVSDAYADAQFQSQLKGFFSKNITTQLAQIRARGNSAVEVIPDTLDGDLEWLDDQIDELVPDFRGTTAYSFMTSEGSESWTYTRTENVVFDGSKPLEVLSHTGKQPIAVLAMRLQYRPEYFAAARRIVRKAKEYVELFLDSDGLSSEQQVRGQLILDKGWPLLSEWADLWESKFLPAMKDGQHAWVLQTGNLKSKQWAKDMPPSSSELELPEAAIVTAISSKDDMIAAYDSLFQWFDRVVELARELNPSGVPASYTVPRPKKSDKKIADRYVYPIPDDCPVPKTMAPQALFTDHWMVSSYSELQAESLIETNKPSVGLSLLDPKKNYSSASYIDFGRLFALGTPWVKYAIEQSSGSIDQVLVAEDNSIPSLTGSDVLELWSVLLNSGEAAAVSTEREGGGSIVHAVYTMPK